MFSDKKLLIKYILQYAVGDTKQIVSFRFNSYCISQQIGLNIFPAKDNNTVKNLIFQDKMKNHQQKLLHLSL